MANAIVTGAGGLVGAETARLFTERGLDVIGIDNDMRSRFFGKDASTRWQVEQLRQSCRNYSHYDVDIRDEASIQKIFAKYQRNIETVIHCAAQPSHDWAVREPMTDFTINANGTLILLEATRQYAPDAVFIFVSTNKVYGDRPNQLPLIELPMRFELAPDHAWAAHGIPEDMSHRRLSAQSVWRLQSRRRCGRAGIRALFWLEDGVLPGRLFDRTRPFWRTAPRLPRLSRAVRRDRLCVYRLRIQG
jgi:CDP-paratose 2-epimerase